MQTTSLSSILFENMHPSIEKVSRYNLYGKSLNNFLMDAFTLRTTYARSYS